MEAFKVVKTTHSEFWSDPDFVLLIFSVCIFIECVCVDLSSLSHLFVYILRAFEHGVDDSYKFFGILVFLRSQSTFTCVFKTTRFAVTKPSAVGSYSEVSGVKYCENDSGKNCEKISLKWNHSAISKNFEKIAKKYRQKKIFFFDFAEKKFRRNLPYDE